MINNISIWISLFALFLITGCSAVHPGHMTTYKSNVSYEIFYEGSMIHSYVPSYYPMRVTDDKVIISFVVDLGYDSIGFPFIYTDSRITESIRPFREFLVWSKKPFIKRQETKKKMMAGTTWDVVYYREENDLKTQEPLFLLVRHFGYFYPDLIYAFTVTDIEHLLDDVYYVKYCKEHGLPL